ncbi:MAG TPA: bifunctional precorrin-2 dehydrogenase/sirohydrochlorin ferrochelatase [Desulfobacteria bacterium]|nr:bifunctional precorrin-2 dehydrogenase/sirohydrochlorin ferrochelatase [Desulfobacteria bacterium]
MSEYYPVYLKLPGRKCVVVGGGKVAERKVKSLLDCDASVYVISPKLTRWLEEATVRGDITVARRNFTTTDLENAFLVIGATDSCETNNLVAEECSARNILVNIVDEPDKCNFIVPAVLRQGPLSISISTDGKSPMLARRIREDLQSAFGDEYREFLDLMGDLREHIINNIPEQEKRKDIFHRLVYSDIIDLLRDGQHEKVKERINHVLGSGWTQS